MCDIVNFIYGLGEKISEIKVMKDFLKTFTHPLDILKMGWLEKILRLLPQCFDSKVTAIEESKDMDFLKVDNLLGSHVTYESKRIQLRKKNLALGSSKKDKEVVVESSNEESFEWEIIESFKETVLVFLTKNSKTLVYIYSQWAQEIYKREEDSFTEIKE